MASTLLTLPPLSADLAGSSSPARFVRRNGHTLVEYVNGFDLEAIYTSQLPEAYLGAGLTVVIPWVAESATADDVVWGVSFQRLNQASVDLDDSATWSTEETVTSTAPGTAGQIQLASFTLSDGAEIGSIEAGENFRIRIRRLGTNGSDNMSGAAQVMTIRVSQAGAAGTLTLEEADASPSLVGVTKIIVDNTKLSGTPSAAVLDLSGGGGGGGFFSDGGGTNAATGKGTVAPTAGGTNALAQGDDSNATGNNSVAIGDTCEALAAQSFAAGANCKVTGYASDTFAQGTNQYVNYGTSTMGYGPWFAQGSQNTIDWESAYYVSTYGGGYDVYYSSGFVQGYSNYVSWRGTGLYRYHIGTTVIGSDNNSFGGLNFIGGAKNKIGSAQAGQSNNLNTIFGYQTYVYGSRAFTHGSFHECDASLTNAHVFGDSGKVRFDAQYVWTSDRNLGSRASAGRSQVSQIVKHLATTVTGAVTMLTIPVETNKSYMLKVEIVGRGQSGVSTTGAILALPTGASDQDGRYAIISRDGDSTIRLRNQTTTDSTITLDLIVGYGSLASATATVSISSTNVLIQVNPGTNDDCHFTGRILLVEVGI